MSQSSFNFCSSISLYILHFGMGQMRGMGRNPLGDQDGIALVALHVSGVLQSYNITDRPGIL